MQLPAHKQNRQRRDVASRMAQGLAGLSPPFVSINGGQFTLVDSTGDAMPLQAVHLDCVVVDTLERVSRVFWGVDENGRAKIPDPSNPQPPICFSDNGVGASANAQEPQSGSCNGCRWNVWGSAISGKSGRGVKACGSTKKIAVYVPQHPKHPFLLRIPIMSHDALGRYSAMFAGQNFDMNDVWTRITIVPQQGVGYSLDFQPTFKFDPSKTWTDEAIDATVDGWNEAHLTDQLLGRGDPVWTGALPPPREQATLAAPPHPVGMPAMAPPPAPPPPAAPPSGQPFGGQAQPPEQPAPARQRRQRAAPAPAQPATAQPQPAAFAPPPPPPAQPAAAPFGIQQNAAPPPPASMEDALKKAFGI